MPGVFKQSSMQLEVHADDTLYPFVGESQSVVLKGKR